VQSRTINVIARSACDEAILIFLQKSRQGSRRF
jgi:hypothetical protein